MLLPMFLLPVLSILPVWNSKSFRTMKIIVFIIFLINVLLSLLILLNFDNAINQYQLVDEDVNANPFNLHMGLDGLSVFFLLLTTIIMPIALLSNWWSIREDIRSLVIILLLLEVLLFAVFLVLDILLFYIFFESILPPLFVMVGLFGSKNKIRASFFLFLYTLSGSLFLLLSILTMSSTMGVSDFDVLYISNFNYVTQLFLFYGIFIAFAVKTPTIFLNTWLLKAHVESPLSGSIILAAIVLKLSLYGILRLMLAISSKASINYTFIVFLIGVTTIIYASFSTLRTVDVKELIAYSSVCHAAVYLISLFSNTTLGIEGSILLGLGHGFVSSGLFICAGGVLYDRTSTRIMTYSRGITQLMPLLSVLFFILCLGNCGVPLTLNFLGEFMSLYGAYERLPTLGALACLSIIFSAAYTIFMFNRIAFGGAYSKYFTESMPDLNKREFFVLITLVIATILFGIYPSIILDGLHFNVSSLIFESIDYTYKLLNFDLENSTILFLPIFIKFKTKIYNINWNRVGYILTKIVIVFIIGFTARYFIATYTGVNVFRDFLTLISLAYYGAMATLTVLYDFFFENSFNQKLTSGGVTSNSFNKPSSNSNTFFNTNINDSSDSSTNSTGTISNNITGTTNNGTTNNSTTNNSTVTNSNNVTDTTNTEDPTGPPMYFIESRYRPHSDFSPYREGSTAERQLAPCNPNTESDKLLIPCRAVYWAVLTDEYFKYGTPFMRFVMSHIYLTNGPIIAEPTIQAMKDVDARLANKEISDDEASAQTKLILEKHSENMDKFNKQFYNWRYPHSQYCLSENPHIAAGRKAFMEARDRLGN